MQEDIALQKRRAFAGVNAEVFSVVGGLVATAFIVLSGIRHLLSASTIIMQSRAFSGGMVAFKDMLNGISHLFEQAIFLQDFVQFEQLHTAMRNDGRRRVGRSVDSIEFQDVSFRYPGSAQEVLRHINLTIGRGQSVLVVGANGAGKTTLIKLLSRLYDPTAGRILLNGIDYREYDIDSLRQAVGVIFQEYGRYAFTIAENIALSDVAGGEENRRIVAAARRANVDSFIAGLPRGYETMASRVFDGGVELSVGQWQRVCLGRLFLKESPVMVLDEATASLDVETEAHLLKEIVATFQDRIRILVSHRTFRSGLADQVIVMKAGEIIEAGTHEDLMETASEYARLWQLYHSFEVCS